MDSKKQLQTKVQLFHVLYNSLGVTVSMAMNDYTVSENSSTVEVCTEIVVPADGLEYDVVSTLTFSDGSKASETVRFSFSC